MWYYARYILRTGCCPSGHLIRLPVGTSSSPVVRMLSFERSITTPADFCCCCCRCKSCSDPRPIFGFECRRTCNFFRRFGLELRPIGPSLMASTRRHVVNYCPHSWLHVCIDWMKSGKRRTGDKSWKHKKLKFWVWRLSDFHIIRWRIQIIRLM